MSAVGSSSTVHGSSLFGALARERRGRPVVGDGGGEQRDVDVGERERGVEHRLGGRRRDRLDAGRRRHGEVRGEQHDVGAAPPGLLGERDAHPAGGAVADEADRVERLAGAAGGDEHAPAGEASAARAAARRGAAISSGSAIRPTPHSPSAVSPSSGPTSSTPRASERLGVRARRRVRPHARVHRRRDEHRARGARAPPRSAGCRRARARASRACSRCRARRRAGRRGSGAGRGPRSPAGARAPGRSRPGRTARRRA